MLQRLAKWFINVPIVWNTFQNIVGANSWKNSVYPSVFTDDVEREKAACTHVPLRAEESETGSRFKSTGTLLDFGCSMGNTTEAFLRFKYHGVDIDRAAIEAAKKRWAGTPNVSFEPLDILKQTYRNNYFDNVLFAGTGHHLTDEEIPHILNALLPTLRTGGHLHFFDVIRQPWKDSFITRLIMNNDQGKHMRTEKQYDEIFAPYPVIERRIFPSPDRIIKLQDMLYIRLAKQ